MSAQLWLLLLVVLALLWVAKDRWARALLQWRGAARRLGFELTRGPGGIEISGQLDGVSVTAKAVHERRSRGLDVRYTSVVAVGFAGIPTWLTVVSSRKRPHYELSPESRAFNELLEMPGVTVLGREHVCAALLDAETRSRLLRGVDEFGLRVEGGRLEAIRDGFVKDSVWLVLAIRLIAGLGPRLRASADQLVTSLWRNAQSDPNPAFRRRCLELVLIHHGQSPLGRPAVAWALLHGHPKARFLAAKSREHEGLADVRQMTLDATLEVGIRVQALHHLAASLPPDALNELAALLLDDPTPPVRHWAIDALATSRQSASLLEVADRAEVLSRAGVQHLIGGFRHIDGQDGEDGLLRMLDRPLPPEQLAAVCEALGNLGGAASVVPLTALTRGIFADGRVKRAARAALETIRARLGPTRAGQLSLVSDEERLGGLSLLDSDGGLSMNRDDSEERNGEEVAQG